MAEEVQIIRIDTGDAIRNVGELRQYISDLKNALNDTSKSFEENAKDAEALRAAQAALRDAMYATSTSAEDLLKSSEQLYDENGKLVGSYNDVVKQMAALKSAWRATTDETERAKLGERINTLNNSLKGMDASVGNFQRNVGNYKSALDGLAGGFQATAGKAGSVINPLKNMTSGLQAMSATPVIAILGLLANVLTKVIDSMKKSETATASLSKAFGGLTVVGDSIGKMLTAVGEGVAWLVEKFADLTAAIFGVSEAAEQRKKITEEELELQKRQRETTMANADAELEIAKLREQASDKQKYTAEERLQFLEESARLENDIAQRTYEDLKTQYEIIKAKNALSQSSAEDLKKEADAYAAMVKAETDYYNRIAGNNKKINATRKEMASTTKKTTTSVKKSVDDMVAGIIESIDKLDVTFDDAANKAVEAVLKEEQEANKLAEENAARRLDTLASYGERRKQIAELTIADERERAAAVYDIEQEYLAKRLDALKAYKQAAYDRGDIDAALGYDQQIADAEVAIEMSALTEKARLRDEDQKDAEKKAKAQIQIMQSVASATSGILGSIADMYEQNAGESEKAAGRVKALRIASSTIDTISGAIAAYMGAVESVPGPAGIVLGVLQAATVTAAGLANIAKMKATKVGSDSSSASVPSLETSAFTAAPTVNTDVTAVRNITSASEEDRLNKMASKQKVYLVTSELEANQEDTRVTLDESSW